MWLSLLGRDWSRQRLSSAHLLVCLLLLTIVHGASAHNTETAIDAAGLTLLEQLLLRNLGMKQPPKPRNTGPVTETYQPPQALLDMYKNMEDDGQLGMIETNSLDYDSAFGFWPDRAVATSASEVAFDFTLKSLHENEETESAELQLYLRTSEPSTSKSTVRLQLYEQVRNHSLLLDTVAVDCSNSNSQSDRIWTSAKLDATVSALRWRRAAQRNADQSENEVDQLTNQNHPHGTLLITMIGAGCELEMRPKGANSPVLLVFTNEYEYVDDQTAEHEIRSKRSTDGSAAVSEQRRKRRRRGKHKHRHSKKSRHRVQSQTGQCKRHELVIDVPEIGWEHWIMAPRKFPVYYCDGLCPTPLPNRLNTTNHAIVQGLINSVKPAAAPSPCCVPTEMTAISLLYLDEYDTVKLKRYDNMEVVSCGCR